MREFIVEKTGTTHGFPFAVVITDLGHRCGYVGVPFSHPLHGCGCGTPHELLRKDEVSDEPIGKREVIPLMCADAELPYLSPDVYFDVHGGLTYAAGREDYPVSEPKGYWWFGGLDLTAPIVTMHQTPSISLPA